MVYGTRGYLWRKTASAARSSPRGHLLRLNGVDSAPWWDVDTIWACPDAPTRVTISYRKV